MNTLTKGMFVIAAAAMVAVGCNNASEGEVYKPINEDAKTVSTNEKSPNSQLEGFDPLKDQKQKQMDKKAKEEPKSNLPATSMSFGEYDWDFGTIDEGDRVEHFFKFTNTGSEPLVLEKCKGSCGCTVPECPKEPIAPGAEGEIKVVFNSKGKKNKQTKKVTITANTEPVQTILTIRADVTPAEG